MRQLTKVAAFLVAATLLPSIVCAQGSLAGVVRDTSGAVLPGVTVEAASPALIEKVRSAVSDGTGQYQIVNLAPGTYTLTFTLPGFNTVRREGIELTGTFAAKVDIEMRVGALEETITVTGETPVVDVQSTTRQRVMDREVLDMIPAGRTVYNLGVLVPGVSLGGGGQDVGGSGNQSPNPSLVAHGGRSNDMGLSQNGISISATVDTGWFSPIMMNPASTQEVVLDTAAVNAEQSGGGVRFNYITRDGGNVYTGTFYGSLATGGMQSDNFGDDLEARGLRSPNTIEKVWDVNPGFGGPIAADRVWFYISGRYNGATNNVAGLFHNRNANNPNAWTFDPDPGHPVANEQVFKDGQFRLTTQATPRNKLGFTWHEQVNCYCPEQASVTVALEASQGRRYPFQRQLQADWTSPVTNRLLFEAGATSYYAMAIIQPWEGLNPAMIAVTEQSTGLRYRSGDPNYRERPNHALHFRGVASYVTGAHALKLGFNHTSGYTAHNGTVNQPVTYRFNNSVPNQITQLAYPYRLRTNVDHNLGIFAQDKWTIDQLTMSYGVRYDYFGNGFPEQHLGPAPLTPLRDITFAPRKNLSLQDITPKLGASYDVFGDGKTALKVSLNKYLRNLATAEIAGDPNPVNTLVLSTTRSWADANRNFVPECDLLSPSANGECGAMANANFGKLVPGATYDPDLLSGWGKRTYNWEFSAGVQHEVLPRVAVDVSYFRRWYGNFTVTDNRALGPADFDPFAITAPAHAELPGGGGFTIGGLYDLNPAKFGVPADNYITFADHYGKQIEHWNGADVTLNMRPRAGVLLAGGVSTGRTSTDNCEIVATLENPSTRFCHVDTAFLTQLKLLGSYTVPRIDVLISGTLQSLPGPQIAANYNAPNALVAPSLGRSLSGNAANVTVNLVEPGTMYGERLNQVDLRVGKILRFGKARTTLNVDLYNALNTNPVLAENSNFAAWRQPSSILLARFVKFNVQFDF